jgi:hypothetical protein
MVETIVDTQNDLTAFKCSGNLTEQELLDVIDSFYKGSSTKHTLWQFDGLSAKNISTDALKRIFKMIRSRGNPRKGGRTAIVAPLDLEYGLGRMFEIWASTGEIPYETKVFRKLDEARQWLLSGQ